MPPADSLPTVVYIAGYGRSGSTVLDVLLGNCPDACAVGELFMFFRPAETQRCGCGAGLAECGFWQAVREGYQRRIGSLPADELGLAFRRSTEAFGTGLLPEFLTGTAAEHPKYADCQRALLAALAEVSGKQVIVDSSKTAVEAARRPSALRAAGARVRVIHLVRDGRGCMWSLLRGCNRKLERGDADPQLAWPRLRSVLGWLQANLSAMRQPRGEVLRVRYEDLAGDPRRELARIGRFLDLDTSTVAERLTAGDTLRSGHSISGNRLRHTGIRELRADDAWREELPVSARLLYWLFAWPVHALLLRRPIDETHDSHPQTVASR